MPLVLSQLRASNSPATVLRSPDDSPDRLDIVALTIIVETMLKHLSDDQRHAIALDIFAMQDQLPKRGVMSDVQRKFVNESIDRAYGIVKDVGSGVVRC